MAERRLTVLSRETYPTQPRIRARCLGEGCTFETLEREGIGVAYCEGWFRSHIMSSPGHTVEVVEITADPDPVVTPEVKVALPWDAPGAGNEPPSGPGNCGA